jgi:hypothetical protein
MMNYRWRSKRALAKEIDDVKLPGRKRIFFRRGTVNSVGKGLAVSVLSKIDSFEGMMDPTRLGKCFRPGEKDFVWVKGSKLGITVKNQPGLRVKLNSKPFLGEHFPNFDFWDERIEWHQCPDNLVEGIAYIEDLIAKGPTPDKKDAFFGIHIEGNYVGRADPYSCSRFRLRSPVPFPMILRPVDIRRLGLRLKAKQLRRVAKYEIPEIGIGFIFDYGDFRVWNAALEPDRRNLVPMINKQFNFRIDNFLKLPKDITFALPLIKLTFKDVPASRDGRLAIAVTIGKEICLTRGLQEAIIPIPKSRRPRPIAFDINLSAFEKLAGEGTYIGYENPDPSKDSGSVYLKDEQGEHMIPITHIKKK